MSMMFSDVLWILIFIFEILLVCGMILELPPISTIEEYI
jgi:hypothetical protein